MASKQDRTFARTAMDIERKYNFDKSFSEAMNLAEQAKRQADEAYSVATNIKGIFFFIRYSAYSDGTNMTEEPQADTVYMGTCSTNVDEAPTDKGAYTWTKILGNDGAKGEDGETGVGVSDMKAQYCISSNKITPPTSGWKDTMDAWSKGTYLWIRHIVTYTNGETVATYPFCDSSWEAVNELDSKIDCEEIFLRLSKGNQGVYRDEQGRYYISAELVKAGIIKSKDGERVVIDLDKGEANIKGIFKTTNTSGTAVAILSSGMLSIDDEDDSYIDTGTYSSRRSNNTSSLYIENWIIDDGQSAYTTYKTPSQSKPLIVGASKDYGNYIRNLSDPYFDNDAVNKAYADKFYDSRSVRSANTVLAAPNGSSGTASFRKLVAGDIPGDCIVEQATKGIWTYRKWNSGIAECWCVLGNQTLSSWSTWGSWYVKDYVFPSQTFPFTFTAVPSVVASQHHVSGTACDFAIYSDGKTTTTATASYSAFRPATTSATVYLSIAIHAFGKWK